MIDAVLEALAATSVLDAAALVLGIVYLVLAARHVRWCWVAGGVGSAIVVYVTARAQLPMQAALHAYYVVMSAYGFWRWSRDRATAAPTVTTWPLRAHAVAVLALLAASAISAWWLERETQAAWPFLDSFTTWGSLFTTWLVARSKLENWLYWFVIDSILVFLYAAQGLVFLSLLMVIYLGIIVSGFLTWLRIYRTQALAS
ncbi:MAG: nicotinamide riboside transporter PnuC [Pseudomonadota bacterium]|nr:MAG: nicotinamide mononucleotide transporter [Pseudomonadota bacterium]